MQQPVTQAQHDEFDQRNNFLYFVLGMISFSYSVLGSVDGQVQAARVAAEEGAPATGSGRGTPREPGDSLLI